MNIPLPGYSAQRLLRSTSGARVYRARRDFDDVEVVAKVFSLGDRGIEARAEHEFRLISGLEIEGVVRALGLERAGDELVLLLEHVPGVDLQAYAAGQALEPRVLVDIARSLAQTLAKLHASRVIHRDIKPSNILIEPESGRVTFADFGISVLLDRERQDVYEPSVLAGTLPYVSPEQTGRTEHEVDFRSDLYSLGATLYELATGRQPFEFETPAELVHAHLARRPREPRLVREAIPSLLSDIVMRLLEKAPEHRYQSAGGLAADLGRLASALATGESDPRFELGARDFAARLQLPATLHGRELEQRIVARELQATIQQAAPRLVVIRGGAGLGKSALLDQLPAEVLAREGLLVRARAQPEQSGSPHALIVDALSELADQILGFDRSVLERYREALLDALGGAARVVVDLVPRLGLILVDTEPASILEPDEAEARLRHALNQVVAVAAARTPLVLALDDLQWSDLASLALIREILLGAHGLRLLVVVTVEQPLEAEVAEALEPVLGSLGEAALPIRELELAALTGEELRALLAPTLGRPPDELDALAELVERKTGNNPLFVRQFLVHLSERGHIEAGPEGWTWSLEGIAEADIPDDLLGIMAAKLDGLGEGERALLELAACIGTAFETSLLAAVGPSSKSEAEVVARLYALEQQGLISRVGARHRFSHSGLRDAVREGIEPGRIRSLRRAIGRELLARHGDTAETLGDRLYETVEHLFASYEQPEDFEPELRQRLAMLGYEAGTQALRGAAWASARDYLDHAVRLLDPEARDDQAFEFHFALAQAQGLSGQRAEASGSFDALLDWDLPWARYGEVIARRMRIATLQRRYRESFELGLDALARCGFRFPSTGSLLLVVRWNVKAWARVRRLDLDALMALPEASEPRAVAAMHICMALKPTSYLFDTQLFAALCGFHAWLVLRHGLHPSAPVALSQLGAGLAAGMGRVEEAARLADHAMALAERIQHATVVSRTHANVAIMIWPRTRAWRSIAVKIPELRRLTLEAGNVDMAGYVTALGIGMLVEAGLGLGQVIDQGRSWRAELNHWSTQEMVDILDRSLDFARCVAGVEGAPEALVGYIESTEAEANEITAYIGGITKVAGAWLLGDRDGAERELAAIETSAAKALLGSWQLPRLAVYAAVLATRLHEGGQRRRARKRLDAQHRLVAAWAAGCPENFGASLSIIEAEQARVRGRFDQAQAAYERARLAASEAGLDCLAGVAAERLADLAERRSLGATAHGAARLALAAYERWGAEAVAARVRERFAETLRKYAPRSESRPGAPATLGDSTLTLDVSKVLDTVAVVSEAGNLDSLIERVLSRAITTSGAERGALLFAHEGELVVVARGEPGAIELHTDETTAPTIAEAGELPRSVIHYVQRTGELVLLDEARADHRFGADPYLRGSGTRSLLVMPLLDQSDEVGGALVLENRLNPGCFTGERTDLLRVLAGQAASAFDNARLTGALRRGEAQWRSLVDGVPDVIALLDLDGIIEFINHLAPYDVDPQSLVGTRTPDHLAPDYRDAYRRLFAEVVETGERRELETSVEPDDAPPSWYTTRLQPILVDGEVAKVLSVSTDITMRKHADAERAEFELQLRQQQRLEALGTLAAGIAHEINNPMQGIMGYAELIADQPDQPELVSEFVAEITAESQRAAGIIRNLLSFSRQDTEQAFELCGIGDLIERTMSLIRSALRRAAIAFEVELAADLPAIPCRSQQIQQILMNLIVNARDALDERRGPEPDRRWIRLDARVVERDGRPWVRISVSDNAGGIPDAVRVKIFDPFFTTKKSDQGTGLGLSVSHGIAAEHGGELWLETELGQGSVFHLDLPTA